jgi:PAS domain S-box-containing protein
MDWAASVDAVMRRAPASASERISFTAQARLLALLGSAAPLNALLDGLATYVETWGEGLYCSVYLVDATGQWLRPAAAPSLPAEYVQGIGAVAIGDGQGSCGTAAARRETVVVEDVEQSELWAGVWSTAVAHGLRACWSVPVLDDGRELLGTLAMYSGTRRKPTPQQINLFEFAASLAAFVIQRHRRAEKLLASEARLHAAVAGAGIGLWDSDGSGEGVWFDDWCDRVGIDPCDGPNGLARWRNLVHPDDLERYRRADADCVRGAADHYVIEYRVRTRRGNWRWMHERGNCTARDAAGQPLHFVGVCFDVDDRRRMESDLRESEERFRTAFESAAIGMAMVAPDGRFLRVNQALCRIIGYTTEELLRLDFQTITHPDDLDTDLAFARKVLDGSIRTFEMEKRYFHKGGQTISILLSVSLVRDDGGQPLYFISQIQDITERKRLEQALREATSSEQQRLGREIHDGLSQELTGISLLARAFATNAERTGSPLAGDAAALSAIARNAIETCRGIVHGVSPLTASQGELVDGIRQLVERATALSGRSVKFSSSEDAPVRLTWDARNQLYRIAQEALSNAIAHAGASSIEVAIKVDTRMVRVDVADDGRGIGADSRTTGGFGIATMRYRAAAIHARLLIAAGPTGGTTVTCECMQPVA